MGPAAIVLAGGASRRMGVDKATLVVDGVAMARRVADAVLGGGCRSVVAVGGDAAGLRACGLDVLPDRHPGAGPLGAIVTAADLGGPLLVVACDLPWLDRESVAALLLVADGAPLADVVAATAGPDGPVEPLCALWRVDALDAARAAFAAGARSPRAVIDELSRRAGAVVRCPVAPGVVRNANTPGDLER